MGWGEVEGNTEGEELSFDNQSLGLLLSQLPTGWDGKLEGHQVPDSWQKMMEMYTKLGMVTPNRWRICVGIVDLHTKGYYFLPV